MSFDDGDSYTVHLKDLDMPNIVSDHPDPSVFTRLDRLGMGSSPVEWCNRFVSFGLGYALSWSGVSSCWVGCGVSRDLVRMSRLR